MSVADTNTLPTDRPRRNRRPLLIALAVFFLTDIVVFGFLIAGSNGPSSDPSPHTYDVPPTMAVKFAQQFAVKKLGWSVRSIAGSEGSAVLDLPKWPGGSVSVTVSPEGKGTRVVIRSSPTSGFGPDFGAKLRRARAADLQAGMDDKLPELH